MLAWQLGQSRDVTVFRSTVEVYEQIGHENDVSLRSSWILLVAMLKTSSQSGFSQWNNDPD